MNVLTLVGSLREESLNRALADAAAAELPGHVRVTSFDRLADLPFYDERLEAELPESVVALRAAIEAADALIIATPEHNGSVSAVIKNAIDWASRPYGAAPISGKPVLAIAATPSPRAAEWARTDLIRILGVAGAAALPESFGHGAAHEGLTDEQRRALAALVEGLHVRVADAA